MCARLYNEVTVLHQVAAGVTEAVSSHYHLSI